MLPSACFGNHTSHIPHISKYMIYLAIRNGYIQYFQELVYELRHEDRRLKNGNVSPPGVTEYRSSNKKNYIS